MTKYKYIDYDRVMRGKYRRTFNGYSIDTVDANWYGMGATKGKVAILGLGYTDPYWRIGDYCGPRNRNCSADMWRRDVPDGSHLFVSPESKMSRDVLRQQYRISLNKDSQHADYVVVPLLEPDMTASFAYNVSFTFDHGGKTVLVLLRNGENSNGAPLDRRPDPVVFADSLNREGINFWESRKGSSRAGRMVNVTGPFNVLDSDLDGKTMWFLPKCSEYVDVLEDEDGSTYDRYVFDSVLPLRTAVDITPETLMIWDRNPDLTLLCRNILSSNWNRYPFTVRRLLERKFRRSRQSPSGLVPAFKLVSDAVDYCSARETSLVAPEDWEMFQRWMMMTLGVEGDRGFISPKAIEDNAKDLSQFICKRLAVTVPRIDRPTSVEQLRAMCMK